MQDESRRGGPPEDCATPLRGHVTAAFQMKGTLDPAQQKAATATGSIQLVLAGPGSGKTTTLTGRFVHLVRQGADRRRILALTFTRKAADEMKARIVQALDLDADIRKRPDRCDVSRLHLPAPEKEARAGGAARQIPALGHGAATAGFQLTANVVERGGRHPGYHRRGRRSASWTPRASPRRSAMTRFSATRLISSRSTRKPFAPPAPSTSPTWCR